MKIHIKFIMMAAIAGSIAACANLPPHQPKYAISGNQWQLLPQNDRAKTSCAVTSGRNAITIETGATPGQYIVSSTRFYIPGTLFTVRIGDNIFRTQDHKFQPAESAKIVDTMLGAKKAYLEWVEPGQGSQSSRHNTFRNLIKVEGLRPELQKCQ